MSLKSILRISTLSVLLAAGMAAQAAVVTLTSSGPITIPFSGSQGAASVYPSIINSAVAGALVNVNVTLTRLSHTFPDDLDILLVGPGGQSVLLMSDTGSSLDIVDVNLTFDDSAANSLGDNSQIVSGTYKPSNYGGIDIFPAPAPAGPYGSLLSAYNGLAAAGEWRLFIFDDLGGDIGSLASWSITLTTQDANDVPEPGSLALAGLALLGAFGAWRRPSRF